MGKRITFILGLCLVFMTISGCNVGDFVKTEKDELLFIKISELQHLIEKEEWDNALENIREFENTYSKRKWKVQLLAALDDYKDIELEVELLKENVKDEDQVESLIRLRQIHYRMNFIYNM
ncbi:DUF4363 family protein [Halalkalibacter flavus]|uniref:DUF4363 family protein n=1 Tax=Halalkalibacter flavus TaxID=3090668 RepID=UPI002FCC4587